MRSLSSYLYKQIHPPLLNLFPSRARHEFAKSLARGFVSTLRSECWRSQPVIQIDSPPWFGIGLLSSLILLLNRDVYPSFLPLPFHSASSPLHAFHYGSLRSANTTREHNLRVEIMPPPRRRTEKRGKGGGEPASDGLQVGRRPLPPCGWS